MRDLMDQTLHSLRDRIDEKPVCIIGNLNVDLIIRDVPRMPVWGQEVFGKDYVLASSGQAGYLAFALRGLEIPTALVGNLGQDIYGQQILRDLQACGVDTAGVDVTPGGRTGITVAMVRPDGERAFVSEQGCLADYTEQDALAHWDRTGSAGIVCLVGIFMFTKLTFDACARLLAKAAGEGKATMLDTGWDSNNWPPETQAGIRAMLRHVSLFMPNLDEARAITRQESVEDAALALQQLGPQWVVIKCGAAGSYARYGPETCRAAALPVKVFDAVGAGDVFNAGFMFGLRRGWPVPACLAFGNSASSLYISRATQRFPRLAKVAEVAHQAYPDVRPLDLNTLKGGDLP
jgi:ribokinase